MYKEITKISGQRVEYILTEMGRNNREVKRIRREKRRLFSKVRSRA